MSRWCLRLPIRRCPVVAHSLHASILATAGVVPSTPSWQCIKAVIHLHGLLLGSFFPVNPRLLAVCDACDPVVASAESVSRGSGSLNDGLGGAGKVGFSSVFNMYTASHTSSSQLSLTSKLRYIAPVHASVGHVIARSRHKGGHIAYYSTRNGAVVSSPTPAT
jgi:hypothetical protein